MMKAYMLVPVLALCACSSDTLRFPAGGGGGGGGGGGNVTIPDALKNNLNSASYDPATQTLTIDIAGLDASQFNATYTRQPGLDVNGFEAYDVQETNAQRRFIALFKQSARGTVQAGAVADGGQFNRFFRGGNYARVSAFSMPSSGLATYIGSYAGVINITSAANAPGPSRTTGDVTINADFTNMLVNGGITNRSIVDDGTVLEDVALTSTDIVNGEFLGDVEFTDLTGIGTWGGTFGGTDASDIAGVIVIEPIRGSNAVEETGAFVIPRCGTAGADPTCP